MPSLIEILRGMAAPGAVVIASSLIATGCGAPPPAPPAPPRVLQDDRLAIAVANDAEGLCIVDFSTKAADGVAAELARLRGVRLTLANPSGDGEVIDLPFQGCEEVANQSLLLRCEPRADHRVTVRIELGESIGEARIELVDDVAIRSDVLELSIEFEFTGDDPIEEVAAPHAHEPPSEVAGDLAFHAPVAYLRAGRSALGIIPDLRALERERRIPQALEVRREPSASIRYGWIAHTLASLGRGVRFTRDGATASRLRAEQIRCACSLRAFADATPQRTLAALHADIWKNEVAPTLANSAAPLLGRTWADLTGSSAARSIDASWRPMPAAAGPVSGSYVTSMQSDAGLEARFRVATQSLRTAWAALAQARRNGRQDGGRAASTLQLALTAPRRGGMIPSRLTVDSAGTRTWSATEPGDPLPEHFHAFDAACTGVWLLRLSDLMPELRDSVLSAAQELARFLMQNQRASGSIPSFYDPKYLLPRREVFDDASPECGAAALFLAEYARRTRDEHAADAARAAVRFLASHMQARDTWPDFETLEATDHRLPRPATRVSGSLAPIFAARAAFAVAALTGESRYAEIGNEFCDRVASLQVAWSPSWLPVDLLGSIRATERDLNYADPRAALAADAFLDGYLATGRRDLLQRGAVALRASLLRLDGRGWQPGSEPTATVWDVGTTTAIVERVRGRLGQAAVDLTGGFAEGLDAVWFEDVVVEPGRCAFRLLTEAESLDTVLVSFHNPLEPGAAYALEVNGEPAGTWTDGGDRFVTLQPQRVPRFFFDPPASIPRDAAWMPRARFEGPPLPVGSKTWIEYTQRGRAGTPARIDLEPGDGGALRVASIDPVRMSLALGSVIEARLVHETAAGRRVVVPVRGSRTVTVDTMTCLDVGDDDEAELSDAGESVIVRDPEGRENARRVEPGDRMTWDIPVPRSATSVALSIRMTGAAHVSTGAHPLHHDDRESTEPRTLDLSIADSRLWRKSGTLGLTIAPSLGSAPCIVSSIRYAIEGESEVAAEARIVPEPERRPDAQLRVLIVPVSFTDAELQATRSSLTRVFFGGEDYRMTSAPQPRLTSGSVASLLARISGGLSELRGEVVDPIRLDSSSELLLGDPEPLRSAVLAAVANTIDPAKFDGLVIVHPDGISNVVESEDNSVAQPLVVIAESSDDGSILASGTALLALFDSFYGFERLDSPEAGSFGQFALSATGGGHVPADPAGVNLVRAGWADTVRPAIADRDAPFALLPLELARTRLRLPCGESLPGRGDLMIETRTPSSGDPWSLAAGALVYWELPPEAAPWIVGRDATARVHRLRLSPARPIWDTPFVPAAAEDLFRSTDEISDAATPEGDIVWSIRQLGTRAEDGAARLRLSYLPTDLRADGDVVWHARNDRGDAVPLLTHDDPQLGTVERTHDSIVLTPRRGQGAGIAGRFDLPGSTRPRRIFGHLTPDEDADGLDLRVHVDGELQLATAIIADGVSFEIDLPTIEAAVLVDVEVWRRRDTSAASCALDSLIVLPRAIEASPIRLPRRARSTRLSDGTVYASTGVMRLDRKGRASCRLPVLLPASRSALRMRAGLPYGGAASPLRVSMRLDGKPLLDGLVIGDGVQADDLTPLTLLICDLPTEGDNRAALVDVILEGAPETELHFVNFSVAR